jgi:hypothetical protein
MPTWQEVKAHLHSRLSISIDEPTWLGLAWRVDAAPEPVLQGQRVELIQALGKPHVLILSDVVPADRLDAREMMQHNATLAYGALAIMQDTYVMRQVLPLDDLTLPLLDTTLEFLAHEAARLRSRAARAESLKVFAPGTF